MKKYDITLDIPNQEKISELREYASPEAIRSSYMILLFLLGYEVSFYDFNDKFGISLSTFNRHIKSLRLACEALFGEDAVIVKTNKDKTYILAIFMPRIRLKLGY